MCCGFHKKCAFLGEVYERHFLLLLRFSKICEGGGPYLWICFPLAQYRRAHTYNVVDSRYKRLDILYCGRGGVNSSWIVVILLITNYFHIQSFNDLCCSPRNSIFISTAKFNVTCSHYIVCLNTDMLKRSERCKLYIFQKIKHNIHWTTLLSLQSKMFVCFDRKLKVSYFCVELKNVLSYNFILSEYPLILKKQWYILLVRANNINMRISLPV